MCLREFHSILWVNLSPLPKFCAHVLSFFPKRMNIISQICTLHSILSPLPKLTAHVSSFFPIYTYIISKFCLWVNPKSNLYVSRNFSPNYFYLAKTTGKYHGSCVSTYMYIVSQLYMWVNFKPTLYVYVYTYMYK